ncbi:MAG TPA: sulfite exporter TauE/SafE family protein [Candidatus Bathyarchaeia archaeon]|nr:sulfite exporter TauE/SafE family protein [Candidatus Bathyarchaeia archaeon]
MSLPWLLGAAVIAAASFVQGLAGFGIGLVSLAFLPYVMSPATAVVLMTLYAAVFTVVIFVPLRRDFTLEGMKELVVGTVLATPVGVWVLAALPAAALTRLIGLVLLIIVALEWFGLYPRRLRGRGWGFGAGVAAGAIGGAIGTPGPPIILYAAAQDWSPRTVKANIQAFLIVNQALILIGYWWAGLLDREVWRLGGLYAAPAVAGLAAGMLLFTRLDRARFRRVVFGVLFVSGLVLLIRG